MSDTPASDTGSSLFGDLPSAPQTGGAYRVLARKYRPQTFADLIGQEAMVRTLSNAFDTAKAPKFFVTFRISIKGFEEGSSQGANLRRTGPNVFAAIGHTRFSRKGKIRRREKENS